MTCIRTLAVIAVGALVVGAAPFRAAAVQPASRIDESRLRVCADPNNLPFSNQAREGFENRLAELVAADLHRTVDYTWWAQRRGFVRSTIKAGLCDVLMGAPTGFELTLVTRPYYRSTYAFVSRAADRLAVRTFDDPILRRMRIGVQLVGDDGQNTPPAHALASRGVITNVVGYSLYGNYVEPNPPARIVDAVANGDVDIAIVWAPLAGYFGARATPPLTVTPAAEPTDHGGLPLAFDIGVGVTRAQPALRDAIDRVLVRRRMEISRLLDEYHVPRVARRVRAADVD